MGAATGLDRREAGAAPSRTAVLVRVHRDEILLAAFVLAVVVPLLAGFVTGGLGGPRDLFFGGDLNNIELYTIKARRFDLLLGAYSRYGWNHPGPPYFYLLAPFHAAFGGATRGLVVGTFAINLLAVVASVAVVWRTISTRAAVVFTALLGGALASLGYASLWYPWNPSVAVVPFALFVVLCWAVASGRPLAAIGAAAVGSFVVQTHIGYAVIGAGLAALATGLGVWRTGRREDRERPVWRLWAPAALGTAAVLLLLWLPAIVDELAVPVGNLREIIGFQEVARAEGGHPLGQAATMLATGLAGPVVRLVGLLHLELTTPMSESVTAWIGIAAVVVGLVAWRRGSRRSAVLAALGALGVLLALFSTSAIVGVIEPYLVLYAVPVGLAVAVAAGLLLVDLAAGALRAATTDVPWAGTAVLAVGLIVAAVMGQSGWTLGRSLGPNLAFVDQGDVAIGLEERLNETLGADDVPLIRVDANNWEDAAYLVRRRVESRQPVAVEEAWQFMFGDDLAATGEENVEVVFGLDESRPSFISADGYDVVSDIAGHVVFLKRLGPG